MIRINEKRRRGLKGTLWITEYDHEKWRWLLMFLPQLVAQDLGKTAAQMHLQRRSDLGVRNMPFYFLQVPSFFFFPYITYRAVNWPTGRPALEIPHSPLNRLKGRSWVENLALDPLAVIEPKFTKWKYGWVNPEGNIRDDSFSYHEAIRHAAAAHSYLLPSVQYVYDEEKSLTTNPKTNRPSRHEFDKDVTTFAHTKEYLNWYLDALNSFFDRFLSHAKKGADERRKSIIAGWTINRLAVDTIVTMSTDVPYVRKWQLFAFVDALAALRNELDGTGHNWIPGTRTLADSKTAQDMLDRSFFKNELLPIISQIPVQSVRDAIIDHTETVYDQIKDMATQGQSGPDLLWQYRNSRHGYALRSQDILLLHDGLVPNDLPDLSIALWHYTLLAYPY